MSVYSFGNGLYTGKRSYNIVGRRKLWFINRHRRDPDLLRLVPCARSQSRHKFRGGSQFTVSGAATTEHKPACDVVAKVSSSVPRVSDVGQAAACADRVTRRR